MTEDYPSWFRHLKDRHANVMSAAEALGRAIRQEGPLDEKTVQLIQLAAAAAIRSEGAVHSHARRALRAGARPEEISHAILLLTSTIGFPTASAALNWVKDVLGQDAV